MIFWLGPLFAVCKLAEHLRKNHRLVGVVGLFTGWLVALVVLAMLPVLTADELAALKHRGRRVPLGNTGVVLVALGVCMVILLGFVVFVASL